MRTTLDIDDDVLAAAKDIARAQHRTAGQVISELARTALARPANALSVKDLEVKDGFVLLPSRGGMVSKETIDLLLENADLQDAGLSGKG